MTRSAASAWGWVKCAAPWVLAAVVLALVARQARTVAWPEVWEALRAQSPARLAVAAGLALVSHGLYACFDLIGRRMVGHRLSMARTLRIALISHAFNLNLGAWVGGIALRLRLYTSAGLCVSTVAQIVAHSVITNWLGYLLVAGSVLLLAPPELRTDWRLPVAGLRALGGAMVAVGVGYLALSGFERTRTLRWRARALQLASIRIATLQAVAGSANWLLIGIIAWWLLGGRIEFPVVLGVMLLAAIAGVITHVPANLGVLEAVVVATLGGHLPVPELLAAMLAYRATYYLVPFALALPAYVLSEAAARQAPASG